MTDSGTGSGLKRRIERRVRRKLRRSVVFVKGYWLDFEYDPLLSFAVRPRFAVIPFGKHVDVLVGTFGGVGYDPALHAEVTIGIGGVLNNHCHVHVFLHVAVFEPPFIGVDEDVLAISVEPDRRNLRQTFGVYGREI